MSDIKTATVWTQPGCSLCFKVMKLLEELEVTVEERKVDGAHWTWAQFKEASPNWSNLPWIQLPDGRDVKTYNEFTEIFGKPESIHNPPVKPWAPR